MESILLVLCNLRGIHALRLVRREGGMCMIRVDVDLLWIELM